MKKVWIAVVVIVVFLAGGFIIWQNSGNTAPFLHPSVKFALWSFLIGLLVSISLPLGAISGLVFKPGPQLTAACTAFGAGALMAALSIEIIAPTIFEIVGKTVSPTGMVHDKKHAMYTLAALLIGCMSGGFLFFALDEAINNKGKMFKKAGEAIGILKKDEARFDKERINTPSPVENETIAKTEKKPDDLRKPSVSFAADDSRFEMERADALPVDDKELARREHEHGSSPMALWLGALIDGVPEGFIIGAGFLALLSEKLAAHKEPVFTEVLPYTLIAGLFLSNFPEALSATMGMQKKKFALKKIAMLWISLVVIISVSSVAGYFVGSEIPHEVEIGIEGLAAGAMLTMVAQTMIPEAVHVGGNKIVGLSTLVGYLCAAAFKILE